MRIVDRLGTLSLLESKPDDPPNDNSKHESHDHEEKITNQGNGGGSYITLQMFRSEERIIPEDTVPSTRRWGGEACGHTTNTVFLSIYIGRL